MKAERINQDQIRFTLNAVDLQERNLRVSELAYGSEKTKALFDDMMKTVLEQFGVDFSEKPLMIEAIPVSESTLTITVTRVSGAAELGALFGSNLPDGRRDQKEAPPEPKAATKETKRRQSSMELPENGEEVIYAFPDFESLCRAARHIPQQVGLKNMLYHDEQKGKYYLIVHYKKMDQRIRYVVSLLSQYCETWTINRHTEVIIKEYGRLVIKTRAIQKLAAIEQWQEGELHAGV